LANDHYKLNFEWKDLDDIKIWENKLKLQLEKQKKNQLKIKTSKYIGISKHGNSYNCRIYNNKKKIFSIFDKNEEIVARYRDIYIILFLNENNYELNFKWNDDEKKLWKNKLTEYINDKK